MPAGRIRKIMFPLGQQHLLPVEYNKNNVLLSIYHDLFNFNLIKNKRQLGWLFSSHQT